MNNAKAGREIQAIRRLFKAWYDAMERGYVEKLVSLVTTDVVMKPPDSAPILGKAALERALSGFLDANSETVDYDLQEIEVGGNFAFARILESAVIVPEGGDAFNVKGMHLTILRREPAEGWLIARNICSLIEDVSLQVCDVSS